MRSPRSTCKRVGGTREIIVDQTINPDYLNLEYNTSKKAIKRFLKVYGIAGYTLEKEKRGTESNYIIKIQEDDYKYLRKQLKSSFSDLLFIRE